MSDRILCKYSRHQHCEQEKQDQIEDSLNKKEYVDPFKGSK